MKESPVHIVTKMLIVFAAVLSLVLSALAIAYVGNATALRTSVRSLQVDLAAARVSAQNEIAQSSQERAAQAERLSTIQNDLTGRNKEVADLQSERTELRASKERAEADAASIRNQIAQLGATTDTQAALIKAYRDEVTTLREGLLSAQKREIELVDRVNELDSAREVLEQNARALKEQLEQTKLDMTATSAGGGAGGGTSGLGSSGSTASMPREIPGNVVRARVEEVFKSPTGDTMVVISEGANRGITENSMMHVIRGNDQFIGSIVITVVEPAKAVGRLNTYGRGSDAMTNDTVLSRLN